MRGTTFVRSSMQALLWAGPLATLAGIVAYRFWQAVPVLVDVAAIAIAGGACLLGWPLRHWLRWQPASCVAAVWMVLLAAFAGPVPVLATLVLLLAAIGLGGWLLPDAIAGPWARASIAAVAGMALLAGADGWLLPLPIHPWFDVASIAIAIVLARRSIRRLLAPLPSAWREAVAASPKAALLAVLALGLATTACWLPTLQFDDLVYHLALPSQLQQLGYYRMDVEGDVWAVAPWAGDILQALVQEFARSESRGALDALWTLLSAALLWELGGEYELQPVFRWTLVGVYATLPMVAMLAGGMQTEGPATAVMLALALLVSRAPAIPDGRVLRCAAALAGLLCGLKILHAVAIAPMGAWLLWRWRGRMPWPALPASIAIGAFAGGSSYAYATWLTGNPLFPLFNDRFRSPFFANVAFSDTRWLSGMHLDLPWQLTFATARFGEHYSGAAGFVWVALAGAALLALARPATRALAASGLFVMLLPLWQVQYLRYAQPGLVLMLPALVAAVVATAPRRAAVALLAGLCLLDFAVQPNAIWILHSGGVARRVLAGRERIVEQLAPERRIAALLAARPASEHALFTGNPFIAEAAGRACTNAWYDPTLQAAAAAADRDASGAAWQRLFANAGVSWVETAPSRVTPALSAALAGARSDAVLGDAQLWRLPATPGRDLAAQRDRSYRFMTHWPFVGPRTTTATDAPARLDP